MDLFDDVFEEHYYFAMVFQKATRPFKYCSIVIIP